MNGWEIAAVVAGGIFTTAVLFFARVNVPRWQRMEPGRFLPDFAKTIDVADKVQPTLLVATIAALVVIVGSSDGSDAVLATAATAGFVATMLGSLAFMVPLQRQMIREGRDPSYPLATKKARWIRGHYGRTTLASISFVLLLLAVTGVA